MSTSIEHAGVPAPGHVPRKDDVNVGALERAVSALAGGYLVFAGLRRGSFLGLAAAGVGAILVRRGMTGHCGLSSALGITSDDVHARSHPFGRSITATKAITILRSPEDVYAFWREPGNLARVMPMVAFARERGAGVSEWRVNAGEVAGGSAGISWEAEFTDEIPGRHLAWRSFENAPIEHHGTVEFRPAPGGRGTEVRVAVQVHPPMGVVGAAMARARGLAPQVQLDETLRRLRQLLETGEIATGQSTSGRRTAIGARILTFFRRGRPDESDRENREARDGRGWRVWRARSRRDRSADRSAGAATGPDAMPEVAPRMTGFGEVSP